MKRAFHQRDVLLSTLEALKYFSVNREKKGYFPILNHHKCLSWLYPHHLNTYGVGVVGIFKRQILTSKVRPALEGIGLNDYSHFKFVSLRNQITVTGDEMCAKTSRFANICLKLSQI